MTIFDQPKMLAAAVMALPSMPKSSPMKLLMVRSSVDGPPTSARIAMSAATIGTNVIGESLALPEVRMKRSCRGPAPTHGTVSIIKDTRPVIGGIGAVCRKFSAHARHRRGCPGPEHFA
jgi:hypothetical protein